MTLLTLSIRLALAQEPSTVRVEMLGGGLGTAAQVLTARHGTSINYEGVPRVLEGVSFTTEVRRDGSRHRMPIYPQLTFSYPESASAREASEAAVAAWNACPLVEGHYVVREGDDAIDLVPFEVLDASGAYVPYAPLLDATLTLAGPTGEPTKLYREIVAELVAAAGVQVVDTNAGWLLGPPLDRAERQFLGPQQALVTLPRSSGTARELLDAVVARNGGLHTNWILIWYADEDPEKAGWRITPVKSTIPGRRELHDRGPAGRLASIECPSTRSSPSATPRLRPRARPSRRLSRPGTRAPRSRRTTPSATARTRSTSCRPRSWTRPASTSRTRRSCVTLAGRTGEPTQLYEEIVAGLVARAGVQVEDAMAGLLLGSPVERGDPLFMVQAQADVTLPRSSGTARELLDAVVARSGLQTNWFLIWYAHEDPERAGWRIGATIARPEHAETWARVTITPAP